ncbi:MAG: glycosyltransferase [Colwellia sp.]
MKEKLLLITRVTPSLQGTGVQLRCARHILSLSKIFDIILVSLTHEPIKLGEITHYCYRYENVVTHKKESQSGKYIGSNFDKAYGDPDAIELFEIKKIIIEMDPSQVFLFRLTTAKFILENELIGLIAKEHWILDLDDIESRANYRHVKANYRDLGKVTTFKSILDVIKMRRLENTVLKLFGKVLICSSDDQVLLNKRFKNNNFFVVPNVMNDVEPLSFGEHQKDILFVGTLSYAPNEQAVMYFCNDILPLINNKLAVSVSVKIVGFNPSEKVLSLANEYVNITGGVDSVEPYYTAAKLVVAPILSGGGTRIKILEAMAFQRAVVSTTIGAEGLGITHGHNILLADNPEAFANSVLKLLESEQYTIKLAINGLNQVKENFTLHTLDCIYSQLLLKERV